MVTERGIVLVTDAAGRIEYVSRSVESWSGFAVAEAVGARPGDLWGGNMDEAFYDSMWKAITVERRAFASRLANRSKSGSSLPSLLTVLPVCEKGRPVRFFAMQPLPEAWNAFEREFALEGPRLSRDPHALSAWIEHWIGLKTQAEASETISEYIERAFVAPAREQLSIRQTDAAAINAAKLNLFKYAEIFSRYYPVLVGYIRRRIDDPGEAEDMAQDVFLKAMNGLSQFHPGNASYKTYLIRIAHHELLNRYRHQNVVRRFYETVGPRPSADQLEDRDAIERAVSKLSSAEQEILHAFYVEGKPVADIARRLGKTENAVKLALSRGRKHIRDTF